MLKQIYQWTFDLVSESPLRIGDQDTEIMLDQNGKPFLPGTSWAGACRAYVERAFGITTAKQLFGEKGKRPHDHLLLFSDGQCKSEQALDIRTGIAIDGFTNAAKKKHLFERVMLSPGTAFSVTLTYKSNSDKYVDIVRKLIHALHQGDIQLGAYKSIGGGRFRIENCKWAHYDCENNIKDLFDYVNQSKEFQEWNLEDSASHFSGIQISFRGETATPLLIGGQYPNDSKKPDRTFLVAKYDGLDTPIIPASSMKGVLRHRVERIANVLQLPDRQKFTTNLFGSAPQAKQKQRGKLVFEDILLQSNNGKSEKTYYRIAINPLTGGVKDGVLIDEETIIGSFETTLRYNVSENEDKSLQDDASFALLLFALRDLALQQTAIGSGSAIGRGYLNISEIVARSHDRQIIFDVENKQVDDQCRWLEKLQQALQEARLMKEVLPG